MEVLEGFDDMSTNQGHAAETPLVQDADVERRGIQLLFGQILCACVWKKATEFLTLLRCETVTSPLYHADAH